MGTGFSIFNMTWYELKSFVMVLLCSRDLKNPRIRLNALESLEKLIKVHFPDIFSNPTKLLIIDKNSFKDKLSHYKKLNSAESSVINNFYELLSSIENSQVMISPMIGTECSSPEEIISSKPKKNFYLLLNL